MSCQLIVVNVNSVNALLFSQVSLFVPTEVDMNDTLTLTTRIALHVTAEIGKKVLDNVP